jgi:thermitase
MVVKFKSDKEYPVLSKSRLSIEEISPAYTNLKNVLMDMKQRTGQITIVKQIKNAQFRDTIGVNKRTGRQVRRHDLSQLCMLKFEKFAPVDSILNLLRSLPEVEYAHQPITVAYEVDPNDAKYQDGSQWNLARINAPQAWDITKGNTQVIIGIVDQGTQQTHPDLSGKFAGGDESYFGSHGTWTAGAACAKTNDSIGVASLGWNLYLYPVDGINVGEETTTADNIARASENADVINMSFGTFRFATLADIGEECPDCGSPSKWVGCLMPTPYQEIESVIGDAIDAGVVCVAAAGNGTQNYNWQGPTPELCDPMTITFPYVAYPASYNGVISVSGTKLVSSTEQFTDGWNYGYFVTVAAPGVGIWTTDPDYGYNNPSGTSFASPQVAALCGLLLSLNPSLTPVEISTAIKGSTDKIDQSRHPDNESGWNPYLGYGRINAYRALKYAIEHYSTTIGGEGVSITFPENVTVASGTTLTILPGTTVRFAANTSLTINGRLLAQGTSSNRIRFTSTNPAYATWFGIMLAGSGANNSVFNYVDIDGVLTYGGSVLNVFGATGMVFTNSTISNCTNYGTTGIYLSNAGSPEIAYNTISACGDYGVDFSNTNGYLYHNTLSSNSSGGVSCYMSSPIFGKPGWAAYWGNNYISGGTYGIYASTYSFPSVGSQSSTDIGFNSIVANSSLRVLATGYSSVYAENNYWGSSSPSPYWFQAINYSYIDWEPFLQNPPGSTANLELESPKVTVVNDLPPTDSEYISEATDHLLSGDLVGARDLFLSALKGTPTTLEATNSLFGLLHIYSESKDQLIPSLVRTQSVSVKLPGATLQVILGELSRLEGDIKEATRIYDAIAEENKGTEAGKHALLQLFSLYLSDPETKPLAAGVLNSLEADFGDEDTDVKQANWIQFLINAPGETSSSNLNEGSAKTKKADKLTASITPATFELAEGYPNPFNPSTTIRYGLPERTYVSLSVFNTLGQKVASLVQGEQDAGYHEVKFDGSRLASGIYFYRLTVGTFVETKKLLLLR